MKASCALTAHFVPPPGRDPWTGLRHDYGGAENYQEQWVRWNRACLGANSASRVLTPEGRIRDIVNNFRFLNFSVSPALLDELSRTSPNVYRRLQEADADSLARLGHGNALARPWTEAILPLLPPDRAALQIDWGLAAFRHHFGRDAEGFCLPHDAVSAPVLDLLVERGLRFILLSPFQAEGVMPIGSGSWQSLGGGPAPGDRPFRVDRPAGSLAVFFPDAGLSHGLIQNQLLRDANRLASALRGAAHGTGFVSVAARGETFGLDEPFADMCLAAVWERLAAEPSLDAVNYASILDTRPPAELVKLSRGDDERGSSASCPHGVGRWHRDCGCRQSATRQDWKAPLWTVMSRWEASLTAELDRAAQTHGMESAALRAWAPSFLLGRETTTEPALAAAARGLHWVQSFWAAALWDGDDPTSVGFRTGLVCALRAFDFVGHDLRPFVDDLAFGINDGRVLGDFVGQELLRRRHDERFGAALFLLDRLLRPRARYQDSLGPFSVTAFSQSRRSIDDGVVRYDGQITLYDESGDGEAELEYLLLEDHREGVSLYLKYAAEAGPPEPFDLQDLPVSERAEIVHLMGNDLEANLASETQAVFTLLRRSVVYARLLDVPPLPMARSLMELAVTRKILGLTENSGIPGPEVMAQLEEELAFARDFHLTLDQDRLNGRFSEWLAQALAHPDDFTSDTVVDSVRMLLDAVRRWGFSPDLTVAQALVFEAVSRTQGVLKTAEVPDAAGAEDELRHLRGLASLLGIEARTADRSASA
jgi:hypothetical protein